MSLRVKGHRGQVHSGQALFYCSRGPGRRPPRPGRRAQLSSAAIYTQRVFTAWSCAGAICHYPEMRKDGGRTTPRATPWRPPRRTAQKKHTVNPSTGKKRPCRRPAGGVLRGPPNERPQAHPKRAERQLEGKYKLGEKRTKPNAHNAQELIQLVVFVVLWELLGYSKK